MDFSSVLSDEGLRAELTARLPDLLPRRPGRLEGLDGGDLPAGIGDAVDRLAEGAAGGQLSDTGLEAIVERFTRPVFLVQDGVVRPPKDDFPESETIRAVLGSAQWCIGGAIAGVGRIELRNHRKDWVGTGWMVGPTVAVTNRHVAEEFARADGTGFGFKAASDDRTVKASIDWRREYQRPDERVVRVAEVLWIEPDDSYDVALLRVLDHDEDANVTPQHIPLMTRAEIDGALSDWIAIIGYPERSAYNNLADQQRIFDGIYGVKRLAPGTIMSIAPNGTFTHNATTLGGNSGSVALHLGLGKAFGLHYGGYEGDRNEGVQATVVADLIDRHVPKS